MVLIILTTCVHFKVSFSLTTAKKINVKQNHIGKNDMCFLIWTSTWPGLSKLFQAHLGAFRWELSHRQVLKTGWLRTPAATGQYLGWWHRRHDFPNWQMWCHWEQWESLDDRVTIFTSSQMKSMQINANYLHRCGMEGTRPHIIMWSSSWGLTGCHLTGCWYCPVIMTQMGQ